MTNHQTKAEAGEPAGLAPRTIRPALHTVAETVRRNPHIFTDGRLRSYIYNSEARLGAHGVIPANGLADAIFRIGRRVFVDEDLLFGWIERKRVAQGIASASDCTSVGTDGQSAALKHNSKESQT